MEERRPLQRIIDSNRIDYASAGVPVFAHPPLPQDFADKLAKPTSGLPEVWRQKAVESLVAGIDPGSRALVTQQLRGPLGSAAVRPLSYEAPDPDSVEQRRRADELDARDPLAALAHPFAYGLDAALDDVAGEDGLLGDWGWRRSIPTPSDDVSGAAGEVIRRYLEVGAPLGGALRTVGTVGNGARLSRVGKAIKQVLATRSGRAVAGGVLSVVAEWRANRDKATEDQPTGWDYGVAFVSGAITGGLEPKWGKAGLDAGVAMAGSILSDIMSERPVSVPGALGAGVAAMIVSTVGGISKVKELRILSQAGGRLGKKYLEKEMKKYISALVGDDLEMTAREWGVFLGSVRDYLRQQWQDFVEGRDADPYF